MTLNVYFEPEQIPTWQPWTFFIITSKGGIGGHLFHALSRWYEAFSLHQLQVKEKEV
ncbi:hypothetical protein ABIE50_000650 [Chitinophaga sp. OAE865]